MLLQGLNTLVRALDEELVLYVCISTLILFVCQNMGPETLEMMG